MFYVITNGVKIEDAFAQGQYFKTSIFDDAKSFAETLKKETGKQYDVVKVEWATTTQTLSEVMEQRKAAKFHESMEWVD